MEGDARRIHIYGDAVSRIEALMQATNNQSYDYAAGREEVVNRSLYDAAWAGNAEEFINRLEEIEVSRKLPLDVIINRVSPSKNTLLHAAAGSGAEEITHLLANSFPMLISRQNKFGDTALHVAAKDGQLRTCKVLVEHKDDADAKSAEGVSLLRMKNEEGNTALHEAVINCCRIFNEKKPTDTSSKEYLLVDCLISADPQLSYEENSTNRTPIYLAVKNGNRELLGLLLQGEFENFERFKRRSPVHFAIKMEKHDMLKQLTKSKPELVHFKDHNGRTPLHEAASVANYKAAVYLLGLDEHKLAIHEKDKDGLYPIHCACKNGDFRTMELLLEEWTDPMEFLSEKRQNILHVAAECGQDQIVLYILNKRWPWLDKDFAFVNLKDKDGNTPLHLAGKGGHCFIVGSLLSHKRINPDILNNEGFTAYSLTFNVAQKRSDESTELQSLKGEKKPNVPKSTQLENDPDSVFSIMALSLLYMSYVKLGLPKSRILRGRPHHEKAVNRENFKDNISNLIVVATLVAGMAFAAAVQLPAGRSPVEAGPGTHRSLDEQAADQQEQISLNYFSFFNSAALNFSILAAMTLCWAQQTLNIYISSFAGWIASACVGVSLYMMFLAFMYSVTIGLNASPFSSIINKLQLALIVVQSIAISPLIVTGKTRRWSILYSTSYCLLWCLYYPFRRVSLFLLKATQRFFESSI